MNIDWEKVGVELRKYPTMAASKGGAPGKIQEAEAKLGCHFCDSYREFLLRYGGAIVGSDPIFGVEEVDDMGTMWSVVAVTEQFRRQGWPGVEKWYVVSMDARGNPAGVDEGGRVWISDHDVGDILSVAESFEEFVNSKLGP